MLKTVGINVDPYLFDSLSTNNNGVSYVRDRFDLFIDRMICKTGKLCSRDELVEFFTTSVAALCSIKENSSCMKKMPKPIMIRQAQRKLGDYADEVVSKMAVEEYNVAAGKTAAFVSLKNEFRDFTFDHIPEMVKCITDYIS